MLRFLNASKYKASKLKYKHWFICVYFLFNISQEVSIYLLMLITFYRKYLVTLSMILLINPVDNLILIILLRFVIASTQLDAFYYMFFLLFFFIYFFFYFYSSMFLLLFFFTPFPTQCSIHLYSV